MDPFPLERIRHVAKLAELELSPEEEVQLSGEIGKILAHIAELAELDTTDVPPTAHVSALASPLRPDVVEDGLSNEDALAAAPRAAHGGFEVPTFVE